MKSDRIYVPYFPLQGDPKPSPTRGRRFQLGDRTVRDSELYARVMNGAAMAMWEHDLKEHADKVDNPEALPSDAHYVLLLFKERSVHVPGDERSRTHPGHGYPAHDVTFRGCEYWVVKDGHEMSAVIELLEEAKKNCDYSSKPVYAVLRAKALKVRLQPMVEDFDEI